MSVSSEFDLTPSSVIPPPARVPDPEVGRVSSISAIVAANTAPRASTPSVRVSGGLLCACRGAFVECGSWESVRQELAERLQIDGNALDALRASDWLEIEALITLLDTQLAYMDLDALKARVRRQVSRFEHGHVYAPMLRSWARSFASPEHMLRALGPLLRAGLRNVEVPTVRVLSAGEAHVLVRGELLSLLLRSESVRAAFEGLLLGLLDLARPQPLLPEVELVLSHEHAGVRDERDEARAVCRF